MQTLHQFMAGYANNDALSNLARSLRTLFRSWGLASDIFCESRRILPELRADARDIAEAASLAPRDGALLHFSIGSPVNDAFAALPCRKALFYHNITPGHFFRRVNPQTARLLDVGREQLRRMNGTAELNMASSLFNARELEAEGYRDVRFLPPLIGLEAVRQPADRAEMRRWDDGCVNILFVGRCAPNKRIEDALRVFACFQKTVEPFSRFLHVGSFAGVERYYHLLLSQAREMGLARVRFAGSLPQARLNAAYRSAGAFLCMSAHEGFCVPLLEAMALDVPVLALDAGAVPETLGGAGVLVREKRYPEIAEMLGRLTREGPLRTAVIETQRRRVAEFERRDFAAQTRELLAPFLPAP
jgi:glycosyltransferase involved in cell wall biosynthesis